MYLVTYNFLKCIYHGKKLLDFKTLAPSTAYNAHMYTAEAYCMLGKFQEAMAHLEKAENQSEQNDAHSIVEKVELKFRNIRVTPEGESSQGELLTVKIINKLNRCVVDICSGNLDRAREKLDEVITAPVENGGLGLKEITCESDSTEMLPSYLITLLTYFYLRVKNLKMAKSLIKSRRFVVDTDHIVQQFKPVSSGGPAPTGANLKYSKKPTPMMNYKSIAKSFT